MSLRHALLGVLSDQPRTGYALLKHFGQSLAYAWPASHSQIYPELGRLLDDGLIEQTDTGPRNSKTYAVTEAGVAELRHWLLETEPDRRVRSDGALRLFFLWLLTPEEAERQLVDERTYWQARLVEYEGIRDEPTGEDRKSRTLRMMLEGGIRAVEARLEWLDSASAEVRSESWAEREVG